MDSSTRTHSAQRPNLRGDDWGSRMPVGGIVPPRFWKDKYGASTGHSKQTSPKKPQNFKKGMNDEDELALWYPYGSQPVSPVDSIRESLHGELTDINRKQEPMSPKDRRNHMSYSGKPVHKQDRPRPRMNGAKRPPPTPNKDRKTDFARIPVSQLYFKETPFAKKTSYEDRGVGVSVNLKKSRQPKSRTFLEKRQFKKEVADMRRRVGQIPAKRKDSALWYFGDFLKEKPSRRSPQRSPMISARTFSHPTEKAEASLLETHGEGPLFSFSIKEHYSRADAKRLPAACVTALAKIWRLLDTDGDGLLDFEKLKIIISCAGVPVTSSLIQGMHDMTPSQWARYGVDFDTFIGGMEAFYAAYPLPSDVVKNVLKFLGYPQGRIDYTSLLRLLTKSATTDSTELLDSEALTVLEGEVRKDKVVSADKLLDVLGSGFPVKSTD